MLNSFPFIIIVSILFGFLAGIGVGGGSLLIMWLTLIVHMPHPQARTLNLLFFLPTAIIASLFRWKQGALNIKKVLPAIIAGSVGAAIFSFISKYVDIHTLQKGFGLLLFVTGVRELLYKPKNLSSS